MKKAGRHMGTKNKRKTPFTRGTWMCGKVFEKDRIARELRGER